MRQPSSRPTRSMAGRAGTGVIRCQRLVLTVVAALTVLAAGSSATGTSSAPVSSGGSAGQITAPAPIGGSYGGGHASGDTEAGAAFARWVLDQDLRRELMTDPVVRNEATLGVKVQPNVTKGDVQNLLVALTEGMARTFPGKPLTVIAFYQSGDKLAEADLDPRTNRVNVQFAQ